MNDAIITCQVVNEEVDYILKKYSLNYEKHILPSELHAYPQKLHNTIQEKINELQNFDTIFLTYGNCGHSVEGIRSPHSTLVLPRTMDCIDTLLHDNPEQKERRADSFFVSKGWRIFMQSTEDPLIKRYGEEKALKIQRLLYKNYKNIVFMKNKDTISQEDVDWAIEYAEKMLLDIRYLDANVRILEDMFLKNYDSRHIVLQSNEILTDKHFTTL